MALFAFVLFLGEGPVPSEDASAPPPAPEPAESEGDGEPQLSDLEKWQAAEPLDVVVSSRDFARGPVDAPVAIVEFSDFQCPFCRKADGFLKEVLRRYPNDVRLVYKNYPLDMACNAGMAKQLHAYACKAAVVARCVGAKDPEFFWRVHDTVFATEQLNDPVLKA